MKSDDEFDGLASSYAEPLPDMRRSNARDLTGKRFGRLLVLEKRKLHDNGPWHYLCLCDCGERRVVHGQTLRTGRQVSCGCYLRAKNRRAMIAARAKRLAQVSRDVGRNVPKAELSSTRNGIAQARTSQNPAQGAAEPGGVARVDEACNLDGADELTRGHLAALQPTARDVFYDRDRVRIPPLARVDRDALPDEVGAPPRTVLDVFASPQEHGAGPGLSDREREHEETE